MLFGAESGKMFDGLSEIFYNDCGEPHCGRGREIDLGPHYRHNSTGSPIAVELKESFGTVSAAASR
jgi:hypothetical protein